MADKRRKPIETALGLFGEEVPVGRVRAKAHRFEKPKDPTVNPMVQAYGAHIDPALRCKDCNHLFVMEYAKKYFKCNLRKFTHGELTDHRKHWPACNKFEVFNNKLNHNIIT